jgi:hypothetical protein
VHSGRLAIPRRYLFGVVRVGLAVAMSVGLSQAHGRTIRPNGTVAVTGFRVRIGGRRVPLRRTGSELGADDQDSGGGDLVYDSVTGLSSAICGVGGAIGGVASKIRSWLP